MIALFYNTGPSCFLTHRLVWTFLPYAVWWLCKFDLKLIQWDKLSYIRFEKNFLTQYLFDVSLPITLQRDKFVFSGITLTCAQMFTCQGVSLKLPISLYLDYTRLQYLVYNFHVSETKFLEQFLECTSDSY